MVIVGDTLSSVPTRPLSPGTVTDLAANDHIVTAIPVAPRGAVDVDAVEWIILQTATAGFLLEYVPGRGWIVRERVTGDATHRDEVYRELVDRALDWQRASDGLWTALLDGGRRDLRDLDDEAKWLR